MTRVSVIIPAYNVEGYISQAIESVLAQSYTDYEIIVVDDGSTDGTYEVVQGYADRVRCIRQHNCGRGAARNTALGYASGEYVAFLDADDYWLESKLEKQVALLDRHSGLGFVFAWADAFDSSGRALRTLGTGFPIEGAEGMEAFAAILDSSPPTLTVVARKSCVQEAGLFDEQVYRGQDWDLWLRIALRHPIGFVPEVLACYRLSGAFMPARFAAAGVQQTRPYIVHKVFGLAEQLQSVHAEGWFRQLHLSRAYFHVALVDYALGNIEQAQASMKECWRNSPDFLDHRADEWTRMLADFAGNLYDTFTPPAEAEAFLKAFFSALSPELNHLHRQQRRVFRTVAAGHGFRAWSQGDSVLARRLLLMATLRYPELGRNLGIWSICWRSFAGRQTGRCAMV